MLLKYANEASSVYSTLKNGLKITPSHDGASEVIVILCDEEQADAAASRHSLLPRGYAGDNKIN
jgi:hypothetical protein